MKKMLIGIMTLVAGVSLFAASQNFVDRNGDGICDTYVSRGNKTAYEAGAEGAGQYRNTQNGSGTEGRTPQVHRGSPRTGKEQKAVLDLDSIE